MISHGFFPGSLILIRRGPPVYVGTYYIYLYIIAADVAITTNDLYKRYQTDP